MNNNHTHITVILDRSGSMEAIRDDITGGFNAFLAQQQAEPGQATLSLVQFDGEDPFEILHRFQPIADIPRLDRQRYVPRGTTPLLDALGRGINDLDQGLAALPEASRPGKVIFAVVTDGMENASQEFQERQVEQMIQQRTERDGWQFVFLSADMSAVAQAVSIGFKPQSSMRFTKNKMGSHQAFASLSRQTSAYRKGQSKKVGFDYDDHLQQEQADKAGP